MSEKMSRPPETESLTRRKFNKIAVERLRDIAIAGSLLRPFYQPTKEAFVKFRSIGHDYSNDPFLGDAVRIDRARLDTLLTGSDDIVLPSYQSNENWQENTESTAEYAFFLDEPGPVYAEFEGLQGDTSLVILRASVDDDEETLIPLIRDPEDQTPITIQLGTQEPGRHRLNISVEHGEIDPLELHPVFTKGNPDSLRSLIDIYQPIIFPRDTRKIANNFPVRTFAFVYELDDAIALVYWKECITEDKEYGQFGTSANQLFTTKHRTTDIDWDCEVIIGKNSGQPKLINIAEPYHNRVSIPTDATPRTPLRVASLNNNVELVSDNYAKHNKGISIRSSIHTHDERWEVLYSTNPAIARLSVLEHIRKGHLDPTNPADAAIIKSSGVDV